MTLIKTALIFTALGATATVSAPAAAQEPVVAATDPEALFTDPNPTLNANKQAVLHNDQWRIVDGRADEHWDTATLDPPK